MTMCASTGVAAARVCVRQPAVCLGKTVPTLKKLFSRWATFSGYHPVHGFTELRRTRAVITRHDQADLLEMAFAVARLCESPISPTNRRLDSKAQS
jgi:hypothetical protein